MLAPAKEEREEVSRCLGEASDKRNKMTEEMQGRYVQCNANEAEARERTRRADAIARKAFTYREEAHRERAAVEEEWAWLSEEVKRLANDARRSKDKANATDARLQRKSQSCTRGLTRRGGPLEGGGGSQQISTSS